MKRFLIIITAVLLLLPLVSAEMELKSSAINPVVLKEFSFPATYNLEINPEVLDYYYINTYLPLDFSPTEIGMIYPNSRKGVALNISPSKEFKEDNYGNTAIEYFVRGETTPLKRSVLVLSILPIKDFVNIDMLPSITVDDSRIFLNISAKTNLTEDAYLKITSDLFSKELPIKLTKEVQGIEMDVNALDKDAKVYTINFEFTIGDETAVVEKELILGPSFSMDSSEAILGNVLSKEYSVTKTNNGNSPTKATIEMSKTIWTSLFTSVEGEPTVTKDGTVYVYSWEKELNPKESFTAVLKINYYVPFLILLLIIIAFAIYRAVTTSQIEIKKSAVRVKTRSGLFASKIIITVKNKGGPVSNLKVIDRLPAFTELLPERFGILEPSEVRKRSLIWDFPTMDRAEEIMFSYIVYSKVTIFGKLEVPPALVTFIDKSANAKETFSNKVFILSEEQKVEKF
ncbi:MAG: hypothetical protein KKE23_00520 [Nanoarchaeota archaeon]|nr:hypothetical protein [Nanoarchaeota archaeon]